MSLVEDQQLIEDLAAQRSDQGQRRRSRGLAEEYVVV
jgi:hypothetical protein